MCVGFALVRHFFALRIALPDCARLPFLHGAIPHSVTFLSGILGSISFLISPFQVKVTE